MVADTKTFLQALFADLQEGELIELRFISPEGSATPRFLDNVDDTYKAALAAGSEVNVYFGVAPRKAPRGTKAAVSRVQALWVDLDADKFNNSKAEAFQALDKFAPAPSFVVDTGYGCHAYWLLSESISAEDAELANKELQRATGGDNVWDAGRVMRVPGTFNLKQQAEGVVAPTAVTRQRADLTYQVDDLLVAAAIPEPVLKLIMTGGHKGFRSRSERDWAIVVALEDLGLGSQAIKKIFQERPCGGKYRDTNGKHYLEYTITQAEDRIAIPNQDTVSIIPAMSKVFQEREEGMFSRTKQGGVAQVATFTMNPQRLLEGETGDTLLVDITASGHTWPGIPITKRAFTRVDTLLRELPVAAWQWLGTDRQVRQLLPYLMTKWKANGSPLARYTSTIGRWEDLWVAEDTILSKDGVVPSEESPIVYLPQHREHPEVDYTIPKAQECRELCQSIFTLYPKINVPEVVHPVLGWFAAAPLKPVFEQSGIRFPTLGIYGTRGSGKTSLLLQVMQRLFGTVQPRSYDCNTTQFVLLSLLSSTNGVPIAFSEYRRSSLSATEYSRVTRYLLLSYDVGRDARGRPDQTTQEYPLTAPFTLDGEDPVTDPACKERTLIVNLRPETIAEGSEAYRAYQELVALPLEDFAGRYIMYTLGLDAEKLKEEWQLSYELTQAGLPDQMPDRVRRNITTCLTGYRLMHYFLYSGFGVEVPDADAEWVEATFAPVLYESVLAGLGRTRLMADDFVEEVVNYLALPEHRVEFLYKYDVAENVLSLHLATAYRWWQVQRRRAGEEFLTSAALKQQLKERSFEVMSGPGQYVIERKAVSIGGATKWMYVIDLEIATEAGLDIPSSLPAEDELIIKLQRGVQN